MSRAVFLDRDGVINRKAPEGAYITRWEELEILPGVPEAIALLNRAGYHVIVATNQRCVAKGLISAEGLHALHARLCEELAETGARIDAIYYCPHDNQPACECRKPAPGLLLRAAAERDIDLTESWMIGDSDADMRAGESAGCRTMKIGGASDRLTAASLLEAVRGVLSLRV